MWTMEELMELKTPFLTMQDITKKDWEHLDFELEKIALRDIIIIKCVRMIIM